MQALSHPHRRLLIIAGAALVALLLGGFGAHAALNPGAVPRLVPYQGSLEQDGVPVDGNVDLIFSLYETANGGSALWEESHTGVSVTNGRFTTLLGTQVAVPNDVLGAPELFLEIQIDSDVLTGRQRFFASSMAPAAAHGVPPGSIVAYGGATAPAGWLLCDGSEVGRTDFAALFGAVGTAHGAGDGSTTFHLPDHRGRFLRGVSGASDRDPDRDSRGTSQPGGNEGNAVGSTQGDELRAHRHALISLGTFTTGPPFDTVLHGANGFVQELGTVQPTGGNETRPVNAYVNWIIKY